MRRNDARHAMEIHVFHTPDQATAAATDWLVSRLTQPATKNIMVAGGNTPLPLYAQVAQRKRPLGHLHVFALDDYVGVPEEEPRNCANLLRTAVIEAWNIPAHQYHSVSSCERAAADSITRHEETIRAVGGLDLVILGLGRNGHIGFNEPGSEPRSLGRVVPLSDASIAANREWFAGRYAPTHGVTTGMRTILAARCVMLLAFGERKADAVFNMIDGPQSSACPASYLQTHPTVVVFLDQQAAGRLTTSSKGPGRNDFQ
jgi:glucosamine-6-phosphate deaminase